MGEVVLSRKEEDQAIVPLLHTQDAKIELLSKRLELGYWDLRQKVGPEIEEDLPVPDGPGKDNRGLKKLGFFRRYFG